MATLHEQLISEISLVNPSLSPQEISAQIAALIEREILPKVLTSIRLPSLPSPLQVKHEELKSRRYGELSKKRFLYEKASFIQELEKFRLRFNGSDVANGDLFLDSMNGTQTPFGQEARFDVLPREEPLSIESETIQKGLKSTPSLERHERLKKPPRLINFDSDISKRIAHDPFFENFIGHVERRIRGNYDRETLKICFNFSTRIDIDDPKRKKTIIHISLPDRSFDEKMELWEKIEADIREVIKKLDVAEQEKKAINRNLFTHILPT